MRGRKPKPTALKKLSGNPGKRKLNSREPIATGTPTCPAHLDAAARAEWGRVVPLLEGMGVIGSVDGAALAAYCGAYSIWAKATKYVAARGLMVLGEPNPMIRVATQAADQMRKFMVEFGMTPSSRSRLTGIADGEKENDPFGELAAEASAPLQ